MLWCRVQVTLPLLHGKCNQPIAWSSEGFRGAASFRSAFVAAGHVALSARVLLSGFKEHASVSHERACQEISVGCVKFYSSHVEHYMHVEHAEMG